MTQERCFNQASKTSGTAIQLDPLEVLRELIEGHFSERMEWMWKDDVSLREADPLLFSKITLLLHADKSKPESKITYRGELI
jgi:hypothetical protein